MLRRKGYSNSPVNDMRSIEVGALTSPDGTWLARQLIDGEQLKSTDAYAAAAAIAAASDCVPFYIHHLVRTIKTRALPCEAGPIDAIVQAQLIAAEDPWELAHYRDRLRTYYPELDKVATGVLDALAISERAMSLEELLGAVKTSRGYTEREGLLDLLKLMARDHYLERVERTEGSGADAAPWGWRWRYPLIRRWWTLDREL
jgi:hypothetical protein